MDDFKGLVFWRIIPFLNEINAERNPESFISIVILLVKIGGTIKVFYKISFIGCQSYNLYLSIEDNLVITSTNEEEF